MTYLIDIQIATDAQISINEGQITDWAMHTLKSEVKGGEVTIRLADTDEITQLNNDYRKRNKPTNVLSFPANIPHTIELDTPLLGDIIICPDVVIQEAQDLNKSLESHFAHMVVHGVLHLLGYDHIEPKDADVMQAKEIKVLNTIGYSNPYTEEENEI